MRFTQTIMFVKKCDQIMHACPYKKNSRERYFFRLRKSQKDIFFVIVE